MVEGIELNRPRKSGLVFDPRVLKTIEEVETVLSRAEKEGNDLLYDGALTRLYELTGEKYKSVKDPVNKKIYQGLDIWVSLSKSKGLRGTGNRTKQKIKRVGVKQFIIDAITSRKTANTGFKFMINESHPELTCEYIVVENHNKFPKEIVELATERLKEFGIKPPKVKH